MLGHARYVAAVEAPPCTSLPLARPFQQSRRPCPSRVQCDVGLTGAAYGRAMRILGRWVCCRATLCACSARAFVPIAGGSRETHVPIMRLEGLRLLYTEYGYCDAITLMVDARAAVPARSAE